MVIFKNWHYGFPLVFTLLHFGKNYHKELTIQFDDSIIYNIDEDQMDVNKLFGLSCGFHQTNSDRIGFRYIPELNKVEIVCYSYACGKRLKTVHLNYVDIGEIGKCSIDITFNEKNRDVIFKCNDITKIMQYNTEGCCKWFHYGLGLYFGGNRTAPHKITIKKI